MTDSIYNALCNRAYETTQAWVKEKWRTEIGTPEEIFSDLIEYDDHFLELWDSWCDEMGIAEDEGISADDERIRPLLDTIERAQAVTVDRKEIGEMVAQARKAKGYSTRELARICGVNYSNIGKIERGSYNVSIDILSKIANALGLKLQLCEIP